MSYEKLDTKLLKEVLLDDYRKRNPKPFIQFDVFCDPQSFDDIIIPDEDGYSLWGVGFTYELMLGSSVRILVSPETSKERVIGSLNKVAEWIQKSDIFEISIDSSKTSRTYHLKIEDYKKEQKAIEIEKKLNEIGYTKDEISRFCRRYGSEVQSKDNEFTPF